MTSGEFKRRSALMLTEEFHCSFEEEHICMFTQDKNDDFDWTRHSAATRDTKYTPNTGPSVDRTGSKQGKETLSLISINRTFPAVLWATCCKKGKGSFKYYFNRWVPTRK